ncbi:MAG: hypothetical protein SWZ49_26060, partial [Cyanobacteriota bacterium]|nr:hypothetical protein [Cyanobacteriota bacterium]
MNKDNAENLTLELKRSGFPMEQVYRLVPHENQYFSYILEDLEIPHHRIDFYTSSLERGKYLLVINSTQSQVRQAESIFN